MRKRYIKPAVVCSLAFLFVATFMSGAAWSAFSGVQPFVPMGGPPPHCGTVEPEERCQVASGLCVEGLVRCKQECWFNPDGTIARVRCRDSGGSGW